MSGPWLDHVGLNVADLAKVTAWYTDVFELATEFTFTLNHVGLGGVTLRHPSGYRPELHACDGSRPGMMQAGDPAQALTRGFGHVAFYVSDVDGTYAELLEAGATPRMSSRPSPEPGIRMAYVAEVNLVGLLDRSRT